MLNQTILIKVKLRLNKLDSMDFDNLESWQIVEAFNKAQSDWCRRQLVGTNQLKQGDEQSERRIDDLNILLRTKKLTMSVLPLYEESQNLPFLTSEDYMAFKRFEVYTTSSCCKDPRYMTVYLVEETNVPLYITDDNKKPSFDWGETFGTMVGRKVRIYTGGEFSIKSASLMYYRQPRKIVIQGVANPYTGDQNPASDVLSEFKDDVCELLIDEAASILAGDIESQFQFQREKANAEANN